MTIDKEFEKLKLQFQEANSFLTTIAVILFSLSIGVLTAPEDTSMILFNMLIYVGLIFVAIIIIQSKRANKIYKYLEK